MEKLNFKLSQTIMDQLQIVEWGYTEDPIAGSYQRYADWVEGGGHGPLSYLSDERKNKRLNLKSFYPEFQSALVFLFSYQEAKSWLEKSKDFIPFKWASYIFAFGGRDYHFEIKDRLDLISSELLKGAKTVFSIDMHPVLERDLAYRAGLGWFGKNSMLINRNHGSFFLIGSILLDKKLNLETSVLETDHCGTCLACADACPTDAIDWKSRTVDSHQCLSTFTIELFKEASPPTGYQKSDGEIFGCDICQDVCPWNDKLFRNQPESRNQTSFQDNEIVQFFSQKSPEQIFNEVSSLSNREYRRKFKGTSLERTGRVGMLKNLKAFLELKS